MPIPTNMLQPLFLYAYDVSEGLYLDVAADFNTPATTTLSRGIYMLCAVGADVTFGIEDAPLDGTNGAHLPAGDTRLIVIPEDGIDLSACLYDGTGDPAKLNIAKVRPITERF